MAKKRIKKKTYSEFLSWLEGVESMQDVNWVPNENQWKTIREMLNNIKPEQIEVHNKPGTQNVAQGAVGRVVDNRLPPVTKAQPYVPQSVMDQPIPQPPVTQQPVKPQRIIPSGMDKKQAELLNVGEVHKQDEYL